MIKFLDLAEINGQYSEELKEVASQVIDSGWYLQGDRVKIFEKKLADFVGVKEVIGVANGLDALKLILRSYIELGLLKEGDEVIVPANTYIASILAITENRLVPVLVEPDIKTYNLDQALIERSITSKTKAIMVVHLYGQVCWSSYLESLASKYNLITIEDNAQAIGAIYHDFPTRINSQNQRRTGALASAAGFSFYPGKNLGALGDSGAVSTNDMNLAKVIRTVANYGSETKYVNKYQGINSRLDELHAAFLTIKLKYLDSENQRRRVVARKYCENIKNDRLILPVEISETSKITDCLSHVWHLFVIRSDRRDILQKYLLDKQIQTLIHYPLPPHKQEAYKEWEHKNLPVTEELHDQLLSLPISPVLKDDDIFRIIDALNKFR